MKNEKIYDCNKCFHFAYDSPALMACVKKYLYKRKNICPYYIWDGWIYIILGFLFLISLIFIVMGIVS